MPIKSLPFEFATNAELRTFSGYASTYKKDLVGDQITQGAFTKTIQERFPSNQIKILWQHSQPIGLPTRMEEDSKGLYVEGRISKTRLGDEALELMRDKVVDTMSIGYDVIKDSLNEDGSTRFLHELKLYEFSIVTFAANPDTSIDSVKNIGYDVTEMQKLIKAGRVLSGANLDKLRNIMTELNALLASAEPQEPNIEPLEDTTKGMPSNSTHVAAFKALINDIAIYTTNYKGAR